MAIGNFYFGAVDSDFNSLNNSEWLTNDNIRQALESSDVKNYHTSVEDFGQSNLREYINDICNNCQSIEVLAFKLTDINPHLRHIVYIIWQYYRSKYSRDHQWLRKILIFAQFYNNEVFFKREPKTDKKKLWIIGSEHSMQTPVGMVSDDPIWNVVDDDKRWGHLVAKELDREEMNLCFWESSIRDGLRRLITNDIDPEDIVIWEIPSLPRETPFSHTRGMIRDGYLGLSKGSMDTEMTTRFMGDYGGSDSQYINQLIDVQTGIDYCNKLGLDLYLISFIAERRWIDPFFEEYPKALDLTLEHFVDLGRSSELVAGPGQNKIFADKIIKFIQGE